MQKRISFFLVLVIMLASLACRALAPTPLTPSTADPALETTPTRQPTKTKLPTRTPSPTKTPKPDEPTATARPTKPAKTATPVASPTPVGSFTNSEGGFAIQYPPDWDIESQSSSHLTINNTSLGMAFIVLADLGDSLETIVNDLKENEFTNDKVTVKDAQDVTLGDGQVVKAKDMVVNSGGSELIYRIAFTSFGPHTYTLIAIGDADSLKAESKTIAQLYGTAIFFSPQAFGTPADQTLGLLSFGDPDPSELDPAVTGTSAAEFVGLLFSGLVRLGPDLQVYPDLAESWEISADGTVYTFTLRPDLSFGDGTPLIADDVVFSWERASDPSVGSSTASTYLGDIVGVKEKLDGKADSISGLKVIDATTLVVRVDAPKPYFLQKLTYPTAFVVDANNVQENPEDWVFNANPSGPYQIMKYTETTSLIFERNPAYHTPPAIAYVAYLLDAGGSAISRYEDGTLDILQIGSDTAERIRREDDPLHSEWNSVTTLCTSFVQMNNNLPPFDDINVRKAFALAVDRNGFVERLTNNLDIPAVSILPPAMPGFNPEIVADAYNETAARAALKASKYNGKLPPITLNTSGLGTQGRADVDALVATWKQVLGVEVQVSFLDPGTFTESAHNDPTQMTLYGWCADYPDPQNFLEVLYKSDSAFNVSGYKNPEIDQLLEQASVELDPAVRIGLYNQAEQALLADYAAVPINHSVDDILVRPRVEGYIHAPLHASFIPWLSLKK